MRFNAYLYAIIWTVGIVLNLLAIFWPKGDINPTMLIKHTLDSSPLIDLDLTTSVYNNESKYINRYGPFLYWPGRSFHYTDAEPDDYSLYSIVILSDPQKVYKIYGQYFDYKNYKTYEELLNNGSIIKNTEDCNDKFKSCGVIDTLGQKLCLPEEIDCPLNDLLLVNTSDDEKINDYIKKGYKRKDALNEKTFLYSSEQKDKPIIGRIVLNGEKGVCANPTEFSWKQLDEDENNNTVTCENEYEGNLYDKTYSLITNISYYDLYEDNIDNYGYGTQKYYDNYFYLFTNKFIGIDKECLKNSNIKDLPNTVYISNFIIYTRYFSIGFAGVNFILVIIILISDLYFKAFINEENAILIDTLEKIYLIINSCAFLLNMVTFVYIQKRTFNFDCSDDVINNQCNKLSNQIIVMMIETLGNDILYFLCIIITFWRKFYYIFNGTNVFKGYFGL